MLILLVGLFATANPVLAAHNQLYIVEPKTIDLGKQGLYINDIPPNIFFVEIEKIQPPLPPRYTYMADISYRGAVLEVTFMNTALTPVNPVGTLTSVYFNVSEPELKLWQEGGSDAIGIWYFDPRAKVPEWRFCPTRLVEEKINNGKYNRLACYVIGNGFYLLGKMSVDKNFPLLFRPYDLGSRSRVEQNKIYFK